MRFSPGCCCGCVLFADYMYEDTDMWEFTTGTWSYDTYNPYGVFLNTNTGGVVTSNVPIDFQLKPYAKLAFTYLFSSYAVGQWVEWNFGGFRVRKTLTAYTPAAPPFPAYCTYTWTIYDPSGATVDTYAQPVVNLLEDELNVCVWREDDEESTTTRSVTLDTYGRIATIDTADMVDPDAWGFAVGGLSGANWRSADVGMSIVKTDGGDCPECSKLCADCYGDREKNYLKATLAGTGAAIADACHYCNCLDGDYWLTWQGACQWTYLYPNLITSRQPLCHQFAGGNSARLFVFISGTDLYCLLSDQFSTNVMAVWKADITGNTDCSAWNLVELSYIADDETYPVTNSPSCDLTSTTITITSSDTTDVIINQCLVCGCWEDQPLQATVVFDGFVDGSNCSECNELNGTYVLDLAWSIWYGAGYDGGICTWQYVDETGWCTEKTIALSLYVTAGGDVNVRVVVGDDYDDAAGIVYALGTTAYPIDCSSFTFNTFDIHSTTFSGNEYCDTTDGIHAIGTITVTI